MPSEINRSDLCAGLLLQEFVARTTLLDSKNQPTGFGPDIIPPVVAYDHCFVAFVQAGNLWGVGWRKGQENRRERGTGGGPGWVICCKFRKGCKMVDQEKVHNSKQAKRSFQNAGIKKHASSEKRGI